MYSLSENFIRAVERFQDKVSLERGSERITYEEVGEKVRKLAYFMSSLGIKRNDRVVIILENRPEWAEIFFALAYIGAVAVPLDPKMSLKDIKNIISDSGAMYGFSSKETHETVETLKNEITFTKLEEIKYETLPSESFKRAPMQPDDLMVILYTSGTTDLPKGVMLTHKNLCSNYNSLRQMGIFSHRDVILSILPLYHSYALMTTFIAPFFSGSRLVYVPADWPERLGDYIKEVEPTVFIGVPQLYNMMHSRMTKKLDSVEGFARVYIKLATGLGLARFMLPAIKNAFGKRIRFFVSGGAKLDTNVARDFFKLGFKIFEGYGLTETSPVASLNPIKRPKIGSIGRPIPDVKMKIVNKDADGVGEIAIHGPNIMKGYYKNEAKTKEVLKNDWFFSGDLGYEDKDGYFYITGRSKEMIVLSSGKNIYPEEVEKHYSATSYIKEICVLSVLKEKGKGKLEYLHAIIVPDLEFFKARGEMNVRKVIKSAIDNLSKDIPPYRHIMGFTVTQEPLARTVLGKLKRYEIQKKFMPVILEDRREEEELSPEDEALLGSDTGKRLIACLKDALDIKSPIRLNDSIELDLGVDSLARVELVLAIERCFKIDITDEMISSGIFTVKDIFLKVEEAHSKKALGSGSPSTSLGTGRVQKEEKAIHWSDILQQPLPEKFQKKILLQPNCIDYVFTFLIKGFIWLFFRIFYRLKAEGADKLPEKGPYVLCVNHTSFLDGFIVCAGVGFRTELDLFFIAFRRYFLVPIVKNLVRRARIIPIDATQIIEAMQGSYFVLKHNKALCIFPEGERSIDGEVKEFKKGIGIIAKELGVPLVPVYIKGAFEAWPRTERFPKLHPVKITFGEPVSSDALLGQGKSLGAKDDDEAISTAIKNKVEELLKKGG